jgi:hypothetical protein
MMTKKTNNHSLPLFRAILITNNQQTTKDETAYHVSLVAFRLLLLDRPFSASNQL